MTSSRESRNGHRRWPACSPGPATPPRPPGRPGSHPWTPRSWTTCSPATGRWPPPGSPPTCTAAPPPAQDARRIARRFLSFEDLILRFATRPDLDTFTNNEAGRTIRPVKAQQCSSGGSWRTLTGLANFAVVASYLSTATKWGISTLDALRSLVNGHAWLPPGLEPAG